LDITPLNPKIPRKKTRVNQTNIPEKKLTTPPPPDTTGIA